MVLTIELHTTGDDDMCAVPLTCQDGKSTTNIIGERERANLVVRTARFFRYIFIGERERANLVVSTADFSLYIFIYIYIYIFRALDATIP